MKLHPKIDMPKLFGGGLMNVEYTCGYNDAGKIVVNSPVSYLTSRRGGGRGLARYKFHMVILCKIQVILDPL